MTTKIKTRASFYLFVIGLIIMSACAPVKNYQKVYLNDGSMVLKPWQIEFNELNADTYREGAGGANGGEAGGGCGCN